MRVRDMPAEKQAAAWLVLAAVCQSDTDKGVSDWSGVDICDVREARLAAPYILMEAAKDPGLLKWAEEPL